MPRKRQKRCWQGERQELKAAVADAVKHNGRSEEAGSKKARNLA